MLYTPAVLLCFRFQFLRLRATNQGLFISAVLFRPRTLVYAQVLVCCRYFWWRMWILEELSFSLISSRVYRTTQKSVCLSPCSVSCSKGSRVVRLPAGSCYAEKNLDPVRTMISTCLRLYGYSCSSCCRLKRDLSADIPARPVVVCRNLLWPTNFQAAHSLLHCSISFRMK